MLEERILKIG